MERGSCHAREGPGDSSEFHWKQGLLFRKGQKREKKPFFPPWAYEAPGEDSARGNAGAEESGALDIEDKTRDASDAGESEVLHGAGASTNPGDGPGSASPFLQAPSERLLAYMDSYHNVSVTWHWTLNNHASTRPKIHGGPIVPSITKCKTFTEPGSASASWQCTLDLPNSFAKDDGIRLHVSSEAPK